MCFSLPPVSAAPRARAGQEGEVVKLLGREPETFHLYVGECGSAGWLCEFLKEIRADEFSPALVGRFIIARADSRNENVFWKKKDPR